MNNTITAPLDPASFGQHLLKVETDILNLQSELSGVHAQLAAAPGSDALHAAARQIEGELGTACARRQRLLDARAEAARRYTAAARHRYVEQMQQRRDQVATMGVEMFTIAAALHTAFASLGPQLAQLSAMGRRRADLAADLMMGEAHISVSGREARQSALTMADSDRGAVAMLLEAALREAGIGLPGPTQGVAVPPAPRFGGDDPAVTHRWHAPDADARSLAQEQFTQTEGNLLRMLDSAIAAAEARLPAIAVEPSADDLA